PARSCAPAARATISRSSRKTCSRWSGRTDPVAFVPRTQHAALAAWCAADPGSTRGGRGSRLCGAALHAAPRPGHKKLRPLTRSVYRNLTPILSLSLPGQFAHFQGEVSSEYLRFALE